MDAPAVDHQRLGFLTGRFDAVDAARGLAIAAMISYHFAWDLSYLRLIAANVPAHPVWRWYAHAIAGSFLLLVGVGLWLAHGRGLRMRAFLRRLALIGGAALAVTIGTWFAFPASYIFFGILHCIAAGSVLALPFLRAPGWITLATAIVVVALPGVAASPALDAPWLAFLGLGVSVPVTNDYVPLFPWSGLILAGVGLAQLAGPRLAGDPERRWRASGLVSETLVWAGRRSLPIYLLHQIVLLGALTALVQVTGPNPAAVEAGFMRDCEATCSPVRGREACRAACRCTVELMKRDGLWAKAGASSLTSDESARLAAFGRQCFAAPQPPP